MKSADMDEKLYQIGRAVFGPLFRWREVDSMFGWPDGSSRKYAATVQKIPAGRKNEIEAKWKETNNAE